MKTLRATAAALIILGAAAAAPAFAQPDGAGGGAQFTSAGKRGAPSAFRGGGNRPHWKDAFRQRPDRGRDHCRKRRCRDRDDFYGWGYGYGLEHEDLLAGGKYGYFSQNSGVAGMSGGSPLYDYDRGYPYEHYSGLVDDYADEAPMMEPRRSRHCEMEATRDRRSGRTVEVRVCRN